MNETKRKSIESAMSEIDKKHGKGSIMFGNSKQDVPVICSSGSLNLDTAIGIGGIPKGRIVEIYGPEASAKCVTGCTEVNIVVSDEFLKFLKSKNIDVRINE